MDQYREGCGVSIDRLITFFPRVPENVGGLFSHYP